MDLIIVDGESGEGMSAFAVHITKYLTIYKDGVDPRGTDV